MIVVDATVVAGFLLIMYVALARQLQVKLVTTDEKILEQFPAVALSPDGFLKA